MNEGLYAKIMAAVPILRPLTRPELDEIVAISRLLKVGREATVIREGEIGNSMYIIVSGRVRVLKEVRAGEQKTLATLGAGEVFGEMALIDRYPRSASVVTLTNTVLYQLDLDRFNSLRDAWRPAAFKVLRQLAPVLCRRIRSMDRMTGEMLAARPEKDTPEVRRELMDRLKGGEA
ncbi:MAG: cyclic nucleotide-binding domain-containing protein [Deltaproteobacteria bacterium]|nr:cyclic nucleotide-binding domain-containing protein [Deltaproteobacteria bacterium]